jgi:thiol-disulfide isomerase/thioredoxin
MKSLFCGLILLVYILSSCRPENKNEIKSDVLQQYVLNMFNTEGLSYDIKYLKKDVFSDDTVLSLAKVSFQKNNNRVNFLRITREETLNELVFFNDSAWDISLKNKSMTYLGGRNSIQYHGLYTHFPSGNFLVDTSIFSKMPYWVESKLGNGMVKIVFTITNKPADITDFNFEIIIDSSELMLRRIIEKAEFGDKGNLYQEKIFSNYKKIFSESALFPNSYKGYKRIFLTNLHQNVRPNAKNISLKKLSFKDLDGKKAALPQDGYIFLDLWYVGCHPCMQATPIIEQIYKQYYGKIQFYSINEIDTDITKVKRFKEKMGMTMPVLLGKEREISNMVSDGSYPLFVLLEASSGKVLWSTSGYSAYLGQQIKLGIDPYLKK